MNCPSRTEEPEGTGFNQNPSALSADLTTRNDLNGIANSRELRRIPNTGIDGVVEPAPDDNFEKSKGTGFGNMRAVALEEKTSDRHVGEESGTTMAMETFGAGGESTGGGADGYRGRFSHYFGKAKKTMVTYGKFVGPGMMVSG
jgi:metal iron transporter